MTKKVISAIFRHSPILEFASLQCTQVLSASGLDANAEREFTQERMKRKIKSSSPLIVKISRNTRFSAVAYRFHCIILIYTFLIRKRRDRHGGRIPLHISADICAVALGRRG